MELAFREYGTGKPLIILHGLFGQSDNWNTLAKRWANEGFRVFSIDQRNHGLSPHSEDWTYEHMAQDLKDFIDQHQLIKPILLGHSMGGKTVMFFEMIFPNISEKTIIADISPRQYPSHHDTVLEALNSVDFNFIKTRKEAEAKLNEFIPDFGTKQFLLKNIYWKDESNTQMDWRFNLKVISKNYSLISVQIPEGVSTKKVLFIKGEKSAYITEADKTDIKSRFLNAEISQIEGAGHWIHAEKPDQFFEMVLNFIKD